MKYFILVFLSISCSSEVKPQSDTFASTIDHSEWDMLLKKHVNEKGDVNYKAFANDTQELKAYLNRLAKKPIAETASKNERLAYYINLYNAGTIRLILENYPLKSIKDLSRPWTKDQVYIGDDTYSLGDIEHKILRKMGEPRIHFAINCASYSCPRLLNEAFAPAKIESQLEESAIAFVNDPKRNKITSEEAKISAIFKWFKKDFTEAGSLVEYLNRYSNAKLAPKAKIEYLDYDWSLNEIE